MRGTTSCRWQALTAQQTLRHIYHHGSHQYPDLHRYLDVHPGDTFHVTDDYGVTYESAPDALHAQAVSAQIERMIQRSPSDIDRLLDYAQIHGTSATLPATAWTTDEVAGPNISDKGTIMTLAKMAANAYVQDHAGSEWKDVKGGFNYTDDFGWQQDGLRGHIFADEKNATIVIGLKGTSVPFFDDAATSAPDLVS